MSKLAHALDAASRNLPVFPQSGKVPGIRSWPTNASTNPDVIKRWWQRRPDADIGVALPSDIYVLDADTPEAMNALGEWDLSGSTLTIATARGVHMYFRVPHELKRLTPKAGGMGLDALEGKGRPGPVTWAGSVHPSGFTYAIVRDVPITWMPGELVRAIGPRVDTASADEASPTERAAWQAAHMANVHAGTTSTGPALDAALDARTDLAFVRRQLHDELPEMATGWADRFYRAGAQLGQHVASGALSYDAARGALEQMFMAADSQGGDSEHVLRSIARGLAAGAREATL